MIKTIFGRVFLITQCPYDLEVRKFPANFHHLYTVYNDDDDDDDDDV
jgi:hypothetical protein